MEDLDSSISIPSLICQENYALFDDDEEEEEVLDDNYKDLQDDYDDEYVEVLLLRESNFMYFSNDSLTITDNWFKWSRSNAIQWIIKTRIHFNFSYQTAYLAVTYYDQFLMKRTFEKGKSWAVELLVIACLSLASKMEECIAPTLPEYPHNDFRFCSNTIQRMELLVLSTLDWSMNPVTPFSFLSIFIFKIQTDQYRPKEVLSRSIGFIFAILDDVNLVDHRPSTIAAAAVLAAYNERLNRQLVENKLSIFSPCKPLSTEHVFSCYTLMVEKSQKSLVASNNCPSNGDNARCNKRRRIQLENNNKISP